MGGTDRRNSGHSVRLVECLLDRTLRDPADGVQRSAKDRDSLPAEGIDW
jgi:hypothetical protein